MSSSIRSVSSLSYYSEVVYSRKKIRGDALRGIKKLKDAFWMQRIQFVIRYIEKTNKRKSTIKTLNKENFDKTKEILKRACNVMIESAFILVQLEKPSKGIRNLHEQLRTEIDKFNSSMKLFKAENVERDKGPFVQQFYQLYDQFYKPNAKVALFISNFGKKIKETRDVLNAINKKTGEGLKEALVKTFKVLKLMQKVQALEKPVVQLAETPCFKPRLVVKISKASKEFQKLILEIPKAVYFKNYLDIINYKIKEIENASFVGLKVDQLDEKKKEVALAVQDFLKLDVNPEMKEALERYIQHLFRFTSEMKEIDLISQRFKIAQLYTEFVEISYIFNHFLLVEAKKNPQSFNVIMEQVLDVQSHCFQLFKYLLPLFCAQKVRAKLFEFVDRDYGRGKGTVTKKIEIVWKRAWDFYLKVSEITNHKPLRDKGLVGKLASMGKVYV